MKTPINNYFRKQIVRMVVTNNMTIEQVLERYPAVTLEQIQASVEYYKGSKTTKALIFGLENKDSQYWETENDQLNWQVKMGNLMYNDVKKEDPLYLVKTKKI